MPRRRKPSRNCIRPTLSSPGGCLGTPSLPPDLTAKPRFGQSLRQRPRTPRSPSGTNPVQARLASGLWGLATNLPQMERHWDGDGSSRSYVGRSRGRHNFAVAGWWRALAREPGTALDTTTLWDHGNRKPGADSTRICRSERRSPPRLSRRLLHVIRGFRLTYPLEAAV